MRELLYQQAGLQPGDRGLLEEIMAYCETRVTADEGIPAIIALDDLTNTGDPVYTPAPDDREMNLILSAGALLFTELYEERKKDEHYPSIAFAMSAVAEKFFRAGYDGEELTVHPYSDVVGAFRKKPEDA